MLNNTILESLSPTKYYARKEKKISNQLKTILVWIMDILSISGAESWNHRDHIGN
jgi:hypothetical protein